MSIDQKKVVEDFYKLLRDRDSDAFIELFAENASVFFPGVSQPSGTYLGRDKIKRFFRKMFTFVPDMSFEMTRVIHCEKTVCVEWSLSGNTRKGGLVLKNGVSIFEVDGYSIVSMNSYIASGLFV